MTAGIFLERPHAVEFTSYGAKPVVNQPRNRSDWLLET
jgi:hypothetical protein